MANSVRLLTRSKILTEAEPDDRQVTLSTVGSVSAQDKADLREALALDDSTTGYVALAGNQTIAGNKTFSGTTTIDGYVALTGTQTVAGAKTFSDKLTANGGRQSAYVAKTSTYPIVAATDYCVNCTSGTFTVTLPTAVGIAGQEFIIKNGGSGVITVATTSSQTIDGVTTATLNQYDALTVLANGANWIIV